MNDRNPQQCGHERSKTISDAVAVIGRITAVVVRTKTVTPRLFRTSVTMISTATARQARDLPFRILRGIFRWFRKLCFTRPRPSEQSVIVPQSKEMIVDLLSQNDFVPGWMISYNYSNEILNFRRAERFAHPSGFEWWQVHIRGYAHADGIELTAHFEPEPRRHPRAHITLFGLDIDRGMDTLLELLNHHEVEYDWIDTPAESYTNSSSRPV